MTDAYSKTVDRLEPDIAMIDPGAFYASAAISLKRLADAQCGKKDAALKSAIMHLEQMAKYIGELNQLADITHRSYSFEALGEDMWAIRDALK